MVRCCLILGDQLSDNMSSLQSLAPDDVVLMVEVWSEATYVNHHKQKIALIFSAMRHFAAQLQESGREVNYIQLDDPENTQDFSGEIARWQAKREFSGWVVTEPGEWRLLEVFRNLKSTFEVPFEILEDARFLASHKTFNLFLEGRKQPRMEHFYRKIRRQTGILMDDGQPVGGQWNFDHENRKRFPGGLTPKAPQWISDEITSAVISLVKTRFANNFGSLDQFLWPVTKAQAEELLSHFIEHRLPKFGDYQDAMAMGNDTLFHSLISSSLNIGLLDPLVVCREAEAAFHRGDAPLNAVEGFIRQILGWREYVRGLYWAYMPEYKTRNQLGAMMPLPVFFWDETKTDMRCLSEAIRNTRENAYAHHIQRLMVTGNFALMCGLSVDAVTDWYLGVYVDAYEWVELPNTLGMALFADGGLMGSKPYCASGKYIDRMSDYCKGCRYSPKINTGPDACPMNYLYWDFLATHQDQLQNNPRMAMMLRNLDRMDPQKLSAMREDAQQFKMRIVSGSEATSCSQEKLL
ncbi:cryptochrome/photolyase family protein [Litorivicinus sp.]|nr:cryptochrome/photolyase family protein [Litorivicinus sp.]